MRRHRFPRATKWSLEDQQILAAALANSDLAEAEQMVAVLIDQMIVAGRAPFNPRSLVDWLNSDEETHYAVGFRRVHAAMQPAVLREIVKTSIETAPQSPYGDVMSSEAIKVDEGWLDEVVDLFRARMLQALSTFPGVFEIGVYVRLPTPQFDYGEEGDTEARFRLDWERGEPHGVGFYQFHEKGRKLKHKRYHFQPQPMALTWSANVQHSWSKHPRRSVELTVHSYQQVHPYLSPGWWAKRGDKMARFESIAQ